MRDLCHKLFIYAHGKSARHSCDVQQGVYARGYQLLPKWKQLRRGNRGSMGSLATDTPERYVVVLLTCMASLFWYTNHGGLCKAHNPAEAGPIPGTAILESDRKG